MPSVIINITSDGETTVAAQGYHGPQCADATRAIERALGKTTRDAKKPEYTRSPATAAKRVRQR